MEVLDKDGHKALSQDIFAKLKSLFDSKVDKEDGKVLSSNDFTDHYKSLLENGYSLPDLQIDFNTMELKQEDTSGYVFSIDKDGNLIYDKE